MTNKKVPMRQCVGCAQMKSKKELIRVIKTPEEQILFLRKCIMVLTVLLAVCIAAIALMFKPTMHYVLD